nr:hypothetical protein H04M03.5 - Caenorhabditis elegans [Caenorhabditis elegans]
MRLCSLLRSFVAIFLSSPDTTFDSPERMVFSMFSDVIPKTTRTFIYVLISCMVSLILYGSLRRELRLTCQVCLSFAAQLILLVYLSFAYYVGEIGDVAYIVLTTKYFPLAYGTIFFIGPLAILIFNKDVSKRVWQMIFADKSVS